MEREIIALRGGGDLGSGVACRLHRSGFRVVILEVEQPLAVRRTVSFAQAVIDGKATVEGITAVRVATLAEVRRAWQDGRLPVMIDPEVKVNAELKPDVIIDATVAKRDTGLRCNMAPLTIALGPGFVAGIHADIVIETNRGHDLGRLIFQGEAEPNTGVPAPVEGHGTERLLRAPCAGTVRHVLDIGAEVRKGEVICRVDGQPVTAPFDGIVRGLIMNGRSVPQGLKIGDVDPRPVRTICYTVSDKARALGGSVLEAILYFRNRAENHSLKSERQPIGMPAMRRTIHKRA
jgi:xanthine dehydrogenase accessory factor